jgi:hypothetical protein
MTPPNKIDEAKSLEDRIEEIAQYYRSYYKGNIERTVEKLNGRLQESMDDLVNEFGSAAVHITIGHCAEDNLFSGSAKPFGSLMEAFKNRGR